METLIKLVKIEWRNPENDWPYFYLLEMKPGWLRLKGADYPDGSAVHEGDTFWVSDREIKYVAEVEQ